MFSALRNSIAGGALAAAALLTALPMAQASTIEPGFNASTLPRNDDGSTGLVPIGFGFNFFGTTYTQLYVNNNGNVTFNNPLSTFTPFGLTSSIGTPILAPFFADVDTRGALSLEVTYGAGTFDGRTAFGVNWVDVGYFPSRDDKLNSFQLIMVDRSDTGAGNIDFYFNYGQIMWETGGASGGVDGLGGSSARAGWSNGTGDPGTNFEIAGSGVNGAFLDGGPNELISGSNIREPGRYFFGVRNGFVVGVPAPASLAILGFGLAGLGLFARRRVH